VWREKYPELFDGYADWQDEQQWQTVEERAAESDLLAFEERQVHVLAELAVEHEALTAQRELARTQADAHERLLLTSQSDALVATVITALGEMGFTVTDSDSLAGARGGPKAEDLRVEDGDWIALAEVKGYAKRNAREGDILQLNKAVETYIGKKGGPPDRRWYIINQSFMTPPGRRVVPLASSEWLEQFDLMGGLVIDTRDLFRLWVAVKGGEVAAEEARTRLQAATGRFAYPDPESDRAPEASSDSRAAD
jgi:hypothetical protein